MISPPVCVPAKKDSLGSIVVSNCVPIIVLITECAIFLLRLAFVTSGTEEKIAADPALISVPYTDLVILTLYNALVVLVSAWKIARLLVPTSVRVKGSVISQAPPVIVTQDSEV